MDIGKEKLFSFLIYPEVILLLSVIVAKKFIVMALQTLVSVVGQTITLLASD
jgi:hypothetical protein